MIMIIASGGCIDFNGVMCDHCDIENRNNDTDFRYLCNSNCAVN